MEEFLQPGRTPLFEVPLLIAVIAFAFGAGALPGLSTTRSHRGDEAVITW